MTRKGYSTIIVLTTIKNRLDKIRKVKGYKSYNQVLIDLTKESK